VGGAAGDAAIPMFAWPQDGAGGAFTQNGVAANGTLANKHTIIGVAGFAISGTTGTGSSNNAYYAGGYFASGFNTSTQVPSYYAYVGAISGGTNYKIVGTGSVSTIVTNKENKRVAMYCPEAPEIFFQDYGSAQLQGGRVHVTLDPTFSKNIAVSSKHPLRVMITLNDECNGVYVTNRTATGFDVVELNKGKSNAAFTYEVVANRADEYAEDGKTLLSKNQDQRFGEAPLPAPTSMKKLK